MRRVKKKIAKEIKTKQSVCGERSREIEIKERKNKTNRSKRQQIVMQVKKI